VNTLTDRTTVATYLRAWLAISISAIARAHSLVDAMGGININVDQDMDYVDNYGKTFGPRRDARGASFY